MVGTVYHGGVGVVTPAQITFPGPRKDCDFGAGFYLTDEKEIAEEWVCNNSDAVINAYDLDIGKNQMLHLSGADWLQVIIGFRLQKYDVKFKSAIIFGLIANDRLFDSLRDFTRGVMGDKRLMQCLDYCKLGSQYCLREKIDGLTFINSYTMTESAKKAAQNRIQQRRRGMAKGLLDIQRKIIAGELYIEDYLQKGDFIEA